MPETRMRLEDWLDDLCVRFIINLPEEDLSSVARICFQVEEAQWFYEDFIRPSDPSLPSMSLRSFCLRIFQHCPLLSTFSVDNHMQAFEDFLQYKSRVPVRGAILLNDAMDSVVLVKGWKKSANWSFPRGKINKDEADLDCAIREVYEETGFDIREAGLIPKEDVKYIDITMHEQQMRLYVFRDVPMNTIFKPRTRKEISKIQWYRLSELPTFRKKGQRAQIDPESSVNANKFYMVAPFLVPLKKWVVKQKKKDAQMSMSSQHLVAAFPEDTLTEEDQCTDKGELYESAATQAPKSILGTLEGATAALHRLLKIQPPTQGLQPKATGALQSPVKSTGKALLALLQGKSTKDSQQHSRKASLQTPWGQTVTPVPSLQTQDSHSRPPTLRNLQPAPSFPVELDWRKMSSSFHGRQPQASENAMNNSVFEKLSMTNHSLPQQNCRPQPLQHPRRVPSRIQSVIIDGEPHCPTGSSRQPMIVTRSLSSITEPKSLPSGGSVSISTSQSFQPQILKRPQQPNLSMPAELAAPEIFVQPPLGVRETQDAEHKQTLLSLFGKGKTSSALLAQSGQPITGQISKLSFSDNRDSLRSRINSLTSLADDLRSGIPPHNGQTTISQEHKGFLLEYLAKNARL